MRSVRSQIAHTRIAATFVTLTFRL
jgi:hypothetical protein